MRLAFACPFYGPTQPLVGNSHRANIINAVEAGHVWVDDYSTAGTQHRNACEAMAERAAKDDRIDAVFWTEHDVILPPFAVVQLAETLEKLPEADTATGIVFRRCEPYNPMVAIVDSTLTRERYEEMKCSKEHQVRRVAALMTYEEVKEKMLRSIHEVDSAAPPFRVDAASMGCLLFRRSTFEKVIGDPELFAVDPLGFFSIDNAFFLRLRAKGLKLFCDPRVLCGHLAEPEMITWEHWRKDSLKRIEKFDLKRQEDLRVEHPTDRIYGELTRLANKYGSDKGTLLHEPGSPWADYIHNYCDFYEAMLAPERMRVRNVFEIGVWKGASLRMWRDFFPNAQIVGMDNWELPGSGMTDEDRIHLFEGDQTSRADLRDLAESHGPFDLIVDDGGHTMEQQQTSLGFLFPYLRPGGYYILEDLQTSFMGQRYGVSADAKNATIHVVEALATGRPFDSRYMAPAEVVNLRREVQSCVIYGKKSITCLIRKRG